MNKGVLFQGWTGNDCWVDVMDESYEDEDKVEENKEVFGQLVVDKLEVEGSDKLTSHSSLEAPGMTLTMLVEAKNSDVELGIVFGRELLLAMWAKLEKLVVDMDGAVSGSVWVSLVLTVDCETESLRDLRDSLSFLLAFSAFLFSTLIWLFASFRALFFS